MNPLYIDIETAPLPLAEAEVFAPEFAAPGNIKDPEKIKAAIDGKRADWSEKLALDARTGRVLVLGLLQDRYHFEDCAGDEAGLVAAAMITLNSSLSVGRKVIGHNLLGFDLPFLCRRAWKLGVKVPKLLTIGRYWNSDLIDTMDLWRCRTRDVGMISLDHLAKHLGVGAKTGDGKDFARLWAGDRQKALAYLENDLQLVKLCYERMT